MPTIITYKRQVAFSSITRIKSSTQTISVFALFLLLLFNPSLKTMAGVKVSDRPHESEYSFPETAALLIAGADSGAVCSGVLFQRNKVLTAAHCLCSEPLQYVFFGHKVFPEIYESPSWYRKHKVKAIHLYENEFCKLYNTDDASRAFSTLDIGLVILEEPMDNSFPTEYLAEFGTGLDENFINDSSLPVYGAGFGKTNISDTSGVKFSYKIEVDICKENDVRTSCIEGKELVAVNKDGTDSCEGDSGGPLYVLQNNELKLVALTSRDLGDSDYCGDGGIYTRVDTNEVQSWLKTIEQ